MAIKTGADVNVLLYATELRPMMTAHLLGMLHAPTLLHSASGARTAGAAKPVLRMRSTSDGALLALQRHSATISLIPLLYKGL